MGHAAEFRMRFDQPSWGGEAVAWGGEEGGSAAQREVERRHRA